MLNSRNRVFNPYLSNVKVRKKAKIRNRYDQVKNRYNQVPHLTQEITWESDKNTRKHHTQESQEVSPFSAGNHKAAMNRQDSTTDTKHTKETSPWNGQLKIILLEGLNKSYGANLTLISNVDQDKKMFGSHERSLTYRFIISEQIQIEI